MRKKIISLLLTLVVTVAFVPALAITSFADTEQQADPAEPEQVELEQAQPEQVEQQQAQPEHYCPPVPPVPDDIVFVTLNYVGAENFEDAIFEYYKTTYGDSIRKTPYGVVICLEKGSALEPCPYLEGFNGKNIVWSTSYAISGDTLFDFTGSIENSLVLFGYPKNITLQDEFGETIDEQAKIKNNKIVKPAYSGTDKYNVSYWTLGDSKDAWNFKDNLPIAYEYNMTLVAHYEPVDTLVAASVASGKKAVKTSWPAVKGARYYVVKGAYCGKTMKTLGKTKSLTLTKKNLKKGKNYKVSVKAYTADGKLIATAPTTHTIVGKVKGKYANVSKTAASKTSVELTVKESKKITAKYTMAKKNKKVMYKHHCDKYRYVTSNASVATFAGGKIVAKTPGYCFVYVVSPNGVYSKTKVTVTAPAQPE